MTLPTRGLTEENLYAYMTKQLGLNPKGDFELSILSGNPARAADVLPTTAVDNAAPVVNATITASEATVLKNALVLKKHGK